MATVEELSDALRNADAAGDKDGARILADEIVKMRGEKPQSLSGLGAAAAGGLGRGTAGLLGLPGDIGSVASWATDKAGELAGAAPETVGKFKELAKQSFQRTPFLSAFAQDGAAAVQKKMEGITGELPKPNTTAEKYVSTIAEFVPGAAVMGPGGVVRRLMSQAVAPGVGAEAAGQYFEGTKIEPYARLGGAVAGATVPGALARVANPMRPSIQRSEAGDVLRGEGVNPTAGQETGSPILRALESPFGGNNEQQLESLTAAAMRRAGEPGGRLTRQAGDQMLDRIGQTFDDLAARNVGVNDRQFINEGTGIVDRYRGLVSAPNRAPAIDNYVQEIGNALQQHGGQLPGAVYQSLRSRMEATARGMTQTEGRNAVRDLRHALDDMMERSIAANNPGDLGGWQEARRQYRNALPLEQAATSGGDAVAQGLLTPGKLSQAVTAVHGRRNRFRGQGEFSELADAADALLRPLPNSGTPVRSFAAAIPAGIGAGLGTLAGSPAGPGGMAGGGMIGAALGHALTGAAVNNPISQAYLAGRIPGQAAFRETSSTAPRDALVQALLRLQEPAPLRITVSPSDAR
jgi:hypothetical protein